jgi:hypothetical protein
MSEFHLPFRVTSRLLYGVMLSMGAAFTLLAIAVQVFSVPGGAKLLSDVSGWVFAIFAALYMYNRQVLKKEALAKEAERLKSQEENSEQEPQQIEKQ